MCRLWMKARRMSSSQRRHRGRGGQLDLRQRDWPERDCLQRRGRFAEGSSHRTEAGHGGDRGAGGQAKEGASRQDHAVKVPLLPATSRARLGPHPVDAGSCPPRSRKASLAFGFSVLAAYPTVVAERGQCSRVVQPPGITIERERSWVPRIPPQRLQRGMTEKLIKPSWPGLSGPPMVAERCERSPVV